MVEKNIPLNESVNLFLHHENQLILKNKINKSLPVLIITGFLGSGKTTLLQHILKNKLNLTIACCINDFSNINIDEKIINNNSSNNICFPFIIDPNKKGVAAFEDLKHIIWNKLLINNENGKIYYECNNNMNNNYNNINIDYLVIETSGTTNPIELINMIQERFGKMSRIRLDAVITVIDVDFLLNSFIINNKNEIIKKSTIINQLKCADIVLLNKMDLLSDNINGRKQVDESIFEYASHAKKMECSYCNIPLSFIMEISTSTINDSGSITHEKMDPHWSISASKRKEIFFTSYDNNENGNDVNDIYFSIDYTSEKAIYISKLHYFLSNKVNSCSIYRMKGWFYINGSDTRYLLQMSGCNRIEITDTGSWSCRPNTSFIIIGSKKDNDKTKFLLELDKLFYRSGNVESYMEKCEKLIEEHPYLDLLVLENDNDSNIKDFILFKVKIPTNSLSDHILSHHFHVNESELTLKLINDVNSTTSNSLLIPKTLKDHGVVGAMVSCEGNNNLLNIWNTVKEHADMEIYPILQKIHSCNCGF